eukprot:9253187-Pyramimonas_sp.AAC.1
MSPPKRLTESAEKKNMDTPIRERISLAVAMLRETTFIISWTLSYDFNCLRMRTRRSNRRMF